MFKVDARETPTTELVASKSNLATPKVDDDVLRIKEIQGNSIAGFMKDHQMFIFLKITDVKQFKGWLAGMVPFIATAEEVLAFNKLFKLLRTRRGESMTIKATWINIAFSFNGLMKLDPTQASKFTDAAFKDGLKARSKLLGDPIEASAEGNPSNWVVGGPDNEADVIVLVASDDLADLFAEVNRIEQDIYRVRTSDGTFTRSGAQIIYKQRGENLPGTLGGHEHFGFLDGVSQPGLRGLLSDNKHDVLTPRQNPNEPTKQGKPGQDLIWPGEFVFGYHAQREKRDNKDDDHIETPGTKKRHAGPSWGDDGSFLVFRRLRQDVPGFHSFVNSEAKRLTQATGLHIEPALLGAKLVGRWPSGAPIMRSLDPTSQKLVDSRALGDNDCANNDFEFKTEDDLPKEPPDKNKPGPSQCAKPDGFPISNGDDPALICPYASHIRKTYPRNDEIEGLPDSRLNEVTTQTHRLLRRGIPFGPVAQSSLESPGLPDKPDKPDKPNGPQRGLLFFAYMTSIENQFEFVTRRWVNAENFKEAGESGHDLILGQNNVDADRRRTFHLKLRDDGSSEVLTTTTDWVIPTGGGYFFSPSISAMKKHLAK
ncbi:MAG TPA: Dyp-type peroxidase [Chloroflexia bacterium]|nr:Dyp-type peroxidase [Chloroflexia bacterium]